jgi:nucleotide-binding universal stress UspA family protein
VAAVRRIFVGVSGSLGSLQALRFATEEARQRDVPLIAVIAWIPPGGELAERRCPSPELRKLWRQAAAERLETAFDEALGGVPDDVRVEQSVVRGATGAVLTDLACGDGDILVIGTGRRGWLHRSAGRYCLAHARCPVMVVPPSALVNAFATAHRPWPMRRHITAADLARLLPPRGPAFRDGALPRVHNQLRKVTHGSRMDPVRDR